MSSPTTDPVRSPDRAYGKVAVKSSVWSFLGSISKQASQFLVSLILARFLSPESFGLIGMVTLATGLALAISEMGLGSAIIQKENATDVDAHSLFWFNLALGISMASGLILLSPLIAAFFHKPELTLLVTGASPVLIFGAVSVIPAALMRKALRFRALTWIDLFCSVFSGGVAIAMAVGGMGVWSLVAQALLLSLSNAFLVYLCSGYRARWIVSIEAVRSFLPFSLNLLGFNLVNYVSRNVDYLLIGKFLGPTPLGLYTLAYKIMLVPLQNISWALGNALFPVFSKFSNDQKRVLRNYKKVISLISAITFPGMTFVHIFSREIISMFYNDSWSQSGDVLKILSVCGMIQSVIAPCGIVFLAMGLSQVQFKLGILNTVATITSILFGLSWGIMGVAYGYTFVAVLWFFVVNIILCKILECKIFEIPKCLFPAFLSFLLISLFVPAIEKTFSIKSPSLILIVLFALPFVSMTLLLLQKTIIIKNGRLKLDV